MDTLELIRDFVNTADLEEGSDKLVDARGLQYWLVFHGLAALRHRATDEDAAAARPAREAPRGVAEPPPGVGRRAWGGEPHARHRRAEFRALGPLRRRRDRF